MNEFDLVMFDLDGTLVETAPEILDAVNDTLNRFNLPAVNQQQVSGWIGHGTHELLIQALSFAGHMNARSVRFGHTLKLVAAEFDRFYLSRCGTRSRLYPRVLECLTDLRKREVKLAVVTNKEARYTDKVLAAHQLSPLLDYVISGDTLLTKKPTPVGINLCLEKLGVNRHRALFVGDSSIDVATARNAGVAVWAVSYGYNMGQSIEVCKPDRVIQDFSTLISAK